MATKRDYYEVLGLAGDISDDKVKRAYYKFPKEYHSDINKETDAEGRFKEVSEAYKVLNDPQKKAAYDRYGHAGADPNYGGGAGGSGGLGDSGSSGSGFGGFEDIFDSFFGGGGNRFADPNAPRQGVDLQYTIQLKFEEVIFGIEREIKYNREGTCATCDGSDAESSTHPEVCHKCHGSGTINIER